ncbi:11125_t:CDS:2, partial [Gigaspora rosea]
GLARLYQKAIKAEKRVTQAYQEEILCWYYYTERFEKSVKEITDNIREISDKTARGQVYDTIIPHLTGITKENIRKKTQKARTIFTLFSKIGLQKIKRIQSYSADSISKLTAIVFGTIQLWKAITSCSISNPPSNEMSEYSNFKSTNEALKIIFSQASDDEITKYEKQLDTVKNLDPVLIITPILTWINQRGLPAYNAVMDAFATNGLLNRRRDKNSRSIFHFTDNEELYTVRDNIRNLIPNAFFIPPSLQAQIPNAQLHPVGTAWILTKVGVRKSDFGNDGSFFL